MISRSTVETWGHEAPALAIAALLAVVATAGEVAPTGYVLYDLPLVAAAAAWMIWVAPQAPRWMPVAMAASVGIAAFRVGAGSAFAFAAMGLATTALAARLPEPGRIEWCERVSVAATVAALSRLRGGPFLGSSLLLAVVLLGSFVVLTVRPMPMHVHRRVATVVAGVASGMLFSTVLFGLTAFLVKNDVLRAEQRARAAIELLRKGDFAEGSSTLGEAAAAFRSAQTELGRPWAYPAMLVPGLAQNRELLVRLVDAGATALDSATDAAGRIDPRRLEVVDGRVDIAAVKALEEPALELQTSFLGLRTALAHPISGWVPRRLADKVTRLDAEVQGYQAQVDRFVTSVEVAPAMLGADDVRRYFVAFTTPAESRSLDGYVGNFAILRADHGRLDLERFGRSSDLMEAAPTEGMELDLPDDFRRRYGEFNFVSSDSGRTPPLAWKNITVSPDLPTDAAIVMQMWQQSFGSRIDGVMVVDPYTLATLIGYTGPISVPGHEAMVTADNAAQFILRDQYMLFDAPAQDERVDALEVLARRTTDALLGGRLPGPIILARDLAPLVRERRLALWTDRPSEQRMLDELGLSGRFPVAAGTADFGITFNNAAPNKADAYLEHTVSTVTRDDEESGQTVVDVTIDLTNTAPANLPPYVAANSSGDPYGSAVLYLSFYGRGSVLSARKDGILLPMATDTELGCDVASNYVTVPRGATTRVTVTFIANRPEPTRGWTVAVGPTAQRNVGRP